MFNGMRIYSSDSLWRQILVDLGASVLDAPTATDVNLDQVNLDIPVSLIELKAAILAAADNSTIITRLLGAGVTVPLLHQHIIAVLYKSGGMSASDLKVALGYSPQATTHAVDNAIYQIRKAYGRDFIQNERGVYKIGHI